MLRRFFNNVIETTLQPVETSLYAAPFTQKDSIGFSWLMSFAPCFPVSASNIKILTEPKEFYDAVVDGCKTAKRRITLVSLYLGNGDLEQKIVRAVKENRHFKDQKLQVNVLLDFTRGSRFKQNSRSMLQPLLNKNCHVSLYHTPVLRGLLKKFTPDRYNELYGLQHMKLYIFDDTLIISGANLSKDYFTNRQDRYFMIKDKQLTDFYCGLVSRVQKFSLQLKENNTVELSKEWNCSPYEGSKDNFIRESGDLIEQYLLESRDEQNSHKQEGYDTWIFPLVQMGQLGVSQDSQVTEKLLGEAPSGSKLSIASGYFNLTDRYMDTLTQQSRAFCDILMAHPQANGFLGAKGPAGGIPYAYSIIAHNFKRKFDRNKQSQRLNLLEYLKQGWTYHAKGLWYYPPHSQHPNLTLIGSPNFGERSVNRDLESQLALVTENKQLREQLHEECTQLYKLGKQADTERRVPKWVYLFVFFFRDYF